MASTRPRPKSGVVRRRRRSSPRRARTRRCIRSRPSMPIPSVWMSEPPNSVIGSNSRRRLRPKRVSTSSLPPPTAGPRDTSPQETSVEDGARGPPPRFDLAELVEARRRSARARSVGRPARGCPKSGGGAAGSQGERCADGRGAARPVRNETLEPMGSSFRSALGLGGLTSARNRESCAETRSAAGLHNCPRGPKKGQCRERARRVFRGAGRGQEKVRAASRPRGPAFRGRTSSVRPPAAL